MGLGFIYLTGGRGGDDQAHSMPEESEALRGKTLALRHTARKWQHWALNPEPSEFKNVLCPLQSAATAFAGLTGSWG